MTTKEVEMIIGYFNGLKKPINPRRSLEKEPNKHRYTYNQAVKDCIELLKEIAKP